ncbi:T6SS immunity protein Tli4 family protein [Massilia sp. SYSU DXS3249]
MKRQAWNWSASMLAVSAVAGVAAALVMGQLRKEEADRRDRDEVARITRKMTPVCMGRFLIDMPDEARLELAQPRVDGFDISSFDEPEAAFKARLGLREARLRNTPDQFAGDKNLVSVSEVKTDNGVIGKIFVHSQTVREGTQANGLELERYRDENVAIEALVHGQGMSFELSADHYDPGQIDNLRRLVAKLVPNPDNRVPTEPGFCVHRAWFRDPLSADQGEQVMMFARLPSHPDIAFMAILAAGNKPASQGLLERTMETAAGLTSAEKTRVTKLRAAPRTIGGILGDEVVTRVVERSDTVVHTFWWEVAGTEDDVRVPHVVFKMYTGKGENGPVSSSLSQDAATALWDRILSSIRSRPVTPSRQSARKLTPPARKA